MKKIAFLLCLVVLGLGSLRAQVTEIVVKEHEPIYNIVKLSPFHFLDGTILLGYERMLSESNSLMVQVGMHSRERPFNDESSFGFQEEVQFRHYVLPPRNVAARGRNTFFFKGFYGGVYAGHRYRTQSVQNFDWVAQETVLIDEAVNEVSGGVVLGAQFALGNVFFMDVYTGGGIKRSWGRSPNNTFVDITSLGYNGVLPKIGFLIGIGF